MSIYVQESGPSGLGVRYLISSPEERRQDDRSPCDAEGRSAYRPTALAQPPRSQRKYLDFQIVPITSVFYT